MTVHNTRLNRNSHSHNADIKNNQELSLRQIKANGDYSGELKSNYCYRIKGHIK